MKVCLDRKQQLLADSGATGAPDVRAAVQEMMTNLFISVINRTVSDGRTDWQPRSNSARYMVFCVSRVLVIRYS